MPRRIVLAIQGPMHSRGISGASSARVHTAGVSDVVTDFACGPNIARIVREHGQRFSEVIVCTWEGEDLGGLPPLKHVLRLKDPGPEKHNHSYRQRLGLQTNKMRQYVSSAAIADHVKAHDLGDFVLRMRSDQYLDLDGARQTVSTLDERFLYFPCVFASPVGVDDFYVFGATERFSRYFEALARPTTQHSFSAHVELLLKAAYGLHRGEIGVPDWAYFPLTTDPDKCRAETRRVLGFMLDNVVRPLPRALYRSVQWRGSPIERTIDDYLFLDMWTEGKAADLRAKLATRGAADSDSLRWLNKGDLRLLPGDRGGRLLRDWGSLVQRAALRLAGQR